MKTYRFIVLAVLILPIGFYCTIDIGRGLARNADNDAGIAEAKLRLDRRAVARYALSVREYREALLYSSGPTSEEASEYLRELETELLKYENAVRVGETRLQKAESRGDRIMQSTFIVGSLSTLAAAIYVGGLAVRAHTAAAK